MVGMDARYHFRRLRSRRLCLAPALAVALASCGGDENPPRDAGVADADAARSRSKSGSSSSFDASLYPGYAAHTVRAGETLWDIARTYGVGVDEILAANSMTRGDVRRLRLGAELRIPGAFETLDVETAADRKRARESLPPPADGVRHFVEPGETVWEIARIYDVPADDIMERNELGDSDARALHVGQPLVIPGVDEQHAEKARTAADQEKKGLEHMLAEGETVWDLARAYGVAVAEIMAANGLSSEDVVRLRDGRTLFVPGVERKKDGGIVRRELPSHRRAERVAERLGLGTRRAASMLLTGRVERKWIRAAGGESLPGTLRWPVTNGWFVRGYGSGRAGYHLAVDIAGEIGWNVRAAAEGIVGYSGDGVKGYGNIVMVIHPGGWITIYAHNSVNFVAAGQKVRRGQILAELGSTGISRGPHVHFELVFERQNCDPAVLFRPGIRHRSGKLTPLAQKSWTDPRRRPRAVECKPRRRYPKSASVAQETAEPPHAE